MHGGEPAVAPPERTPHCFHDHDIGLGQCGHGRLLGIRTLGDAGIVVPVCENQPVPTATRSHFVVLLLTSALVLGACSDDGGDNDDDTGSTSTPATTEAPDSETTAPPTDPERLRPRQPRPRRRRRRARRSKAAPSERPSRSRPKGPPTSPASRSRVATAPTSSRSPSSRPCPAHPATRSRTSRGRSPRTGQATPVPVAGGAFLVGALRAGVHVRLRSRRSTRTRDPTASPHPVHSSPPKVVKTGDFEAVVSG